MNRDYETALQRMHCMLLNGSVKQQQEVVDWIKTGEFVKREEAMKCYDCEQGRRRYKSDGVYYHSYKQSNGVDYDTYHSVCNNLTVGEMDTLRKEASNRVMVKLEDANKKVKKLVDQLVRLALSDNPKEIAQIAGLND